MDRIIKREKTKVSPHLIRMKYFSKKFKIMFGTVNGWLETVENNEETRALNSLLKL